MNDEKLILIALWEQPGDDFIGSISRNNPNIKKGVELFDNFEVCHTYLLY